MSRTDQILAVALAAAVLVLPIIVAALYAATS